MANEIEIVVKGKDDSEATIGNATRGAKEAGEAIGKAGEQAGQGFGRIKDSAGEAGDRLGRFGERADDVDTKAMGFADTMTGVQDAMSGAALIAEGDLFDGFLTLGQGVSDLGSGVFNFLVPSMQSAKAAMFGTAAVATESAATESASATTRATAQSRAAAITTAATTRVKAALASTAAFMVGPWGIAILGAAAVLGALTFSYMKGKQRVEDYSSSLDENTGAITDNTRAVAVKRLEDEDWLRVAEQMGVSTRDLTDAMLGNEEAYKRVRKELMAVAEAGGDNADAAADLIVFLDEEREALEGTREAARRKKKATDDDTDATKANTNANREAADALRAQFDPAFALLDAQRQLTSAQRDYDEAVKEHGPNSAEAKEALDRLAQAALRVDGAAAGVSAEFDGSMSPALRRVLQNAGLTEKEIRDVENRLRAARTEASKWSRDWKARFIVEYHGPSRVSGVTGRGGFTPFAHGGITGAGLELVGEQGPELVDLPTGSTVIPAGSTANMLGGGGGAPVINIYVASTGSSVEDALMEMWAKHIRVHYGGDPQAAVR